MKFIVRPALAMCAAAVLLSLAGEARAAGFCGALFRWVRHHHDACEAVPYVYAPDQADEGGGDKTVRPKSGPEKLGPPKEGGAPRGAEAPLASADSAAEVAARLKAWKDANADESGGTVQRVT